jgi:hypothetical protein
MRTHLLYTLLAFALTVQASFAADTPLDTTLAPKSDEEVSNVFREMGVVQKRSMPKANRFLLSPYATFDFSDGPYSNYSFHINPGYAINDFLEVYLNFVPFYVVSPRSIHEKLNRVGYQILAARPKMQFGAEVLWAPLYGKDSLGLSRIIRSDTFIKLGASQIQFEGGETGMAFKLGIGKTFFLTRSAGFRFCINYGYVQSLIGTSAIGATNTVYEKGFSSMLLTEFGMTFYL